VEYGLFSDFFMNKFAGRKKMPIDIFLIFCHDILAMTKVYFSLHIWKENVEIDQITNFHEKIIWQSLLYRIPLNQTWQGWSLGESLSKLCPTTPPSIQDGCCY
jgi:hypothetical protein